MKTRRVCKKPYKCQRGPWAGYTLYLESGSFGVTLFFTYKGHTGRYNGGVWQPLEIPLATEHLFLKRLEIL